jgi:hypothetical protein
MGDKPDTKVDRILRAFADHPVYAWLIVGAIALTGLGTAAGGLSSLINLFKGDSTRAVDQEQSVSVSGVTLVENCRYFMFNRISHDIQAWERFMLPSLVFSISIDKVRFDAVQGDALGNVVAVLKNYSDGDVVSVSMHQRDQRDNERSDASQQVKLYPGERYYMADAEFPPDADDDTEGIERIVIKASDVTTYRGFINSAGIDVQACGQYSKDISWEYRPAAVSTSK